jgi:transcriptional regulator with XRE-family HTH domain
MIAQRSRRAPVETLSARVLRYRIARGYSPSDLASAAGVWAGAIRRLESGRPVDQRMLAPLAAALGVPLCRLVCGEHSCAQRACAPASRLDVPELPRRRGSGVFAFTVTSAPTGASANVSPCKFPALWRSAALQDLSAEPAARQYCRPRRRSLKPYRPRQAALRDHRVHNKPFAARRPETASQVLAGLVTRVARRFPGSA